MTPGATPAGRLAALAMLAPALQQRPVHGDVVDSTVDQLLLGDTVTPIVQWIFQKPPWVMWGGVILALLLAGFALWWLFRRRDRIAAYVGAHPILKPVIVLSVLAVIGLTLFTGVRSYNFMYHDKRMCNGCHVFVPSGQVVERPDSGDYTLVNRLEGKHDSLNCHSCHPLKLGKEAVKMVMWMSGVRDSTVPEHGKVPRDVCENCHEQGEGKKFWQAIGSTAGHRTHLESDSIKLTPRAECLTCHAQSAHRFIPQNATCSQQGCHLTSDTEIRLGKMSQQGGFHCVLCHQFTRQVPQLATFDSAKGSLTPGTQECLTCHAMQQQLMTFKPEKDPHGGTCGMCHNPHTNVQPKDALKSCAQCHADWKQVAFHNGAAHRKAAIQCESCHLPHAARVDASDCVGCHTQVRGLSPKGGRKLRPPEVFDTTRAIRTMSRTGEDEPPQRGKGDAPPGPVSWSSPSLPPRPFAHARHTKLACIKCHDVKSTKGFLRFQRPRGCLICHHQSPAKSDCANCHAQADFAPQAFPESIVVKVKAPSAPVRHGIATFTHGAHAELQCTGCHKAPVTLATTPEVRNCASCHESHHDAARDCASCHRTDAPSTAHSRTTHTDCVACHAPATISRLTPDRGFCLGCHSPATNHYPERACSECHLLQAPEHFRPRLAGP
jgi:hypothetical protein